MSKTEPHWLGPSAEKYERKKEEWARKEAAYKAKIALLERLLGAYTVSAAQMGAALDDDRLEDLCGGKVSAKTQAAILDRIRHAREALSQTMAHEVIKIAAESIDSPLVHGG